MDMDKRISKTKTDTRGNKTGFWREKKPVLDKEKCNNCYICWLFCPDAVIDLDENGEIEKINYDYCKGCGVCAHECPKDAIEMKEEA